MYADLDKVEKIKILISRVHSSGINYDYKYSVGYTKKYGMIIKAENAYDNMDRNGFYNKVIGFTVKVPIANPSNFVITFKNGYHDYDGLKDYLYSVYSYALEKA